MIDRYTKTVLSIIALALAVLAFESTQPHIAYVANDGISKLQVGGVVGTVPQ
jgi:hypothetical protein